jgi:hypothetical protein
VLEGALASVLSARFDDVVVELGRTGLKSPGAGYDAAVVSDELPEGVRADVVITLPDTRGSGGTGTVRSGEVVQHVGISRADQVVELLERYVSRRP